MARQAARLLTDGPESTDSSSAEVGLPEETVSGETRLAQRPEDLLVTLADRMRHELGAVACDILRYDRDADALEPVAASATGESPPLRGLLHPAADFGEVAAALVSGEPVAITDLAALDVAGPHLVRREQSGARSVYAAPIHLGHAVAGLVEVYGGEAGWMPGQGRARTGRRGRGDGRPRAVRRSRHRRAHPQDRLPGRPDRRVQHELAGDGRRVAGAVDAAGAAHATGLRRLHRVPGGRRNRQPRSLPATSAATRSTTAGRGR